MGVLKRRPPVVSSHFIARPRLEKLAEAICGAAVTVVRAGGGFGKTTLLRAWAQRLEQKVRCAWLSLDSADASATALCEEINKSLAEALPNFGTSLTQLFERGVERHARLVAALVNELLAWTEEHNADAVLFLDDVQTILEDKGAVEAIGQFLRSLPPRVHVVLATRAALRFSPLSKLRAIGAVLDIEESELRFTLDEAAELLSDSETASTFIEQTEGWPIALGLTAHVARTRPATKPRATLPSDESVFDFLASEVLHELPDTLRRALLILSIPVTVDTKYAPALLPDENVEGLVEEIRNRGLYLAKVNDGIWRFHQLFRNFLLTEFRKTDPATERLLRIRYAALLRQNGETMAALDQLLEAEEYEQILEYVYEALVSIRLSDRYKSFLALFSRVPDRVLEEKPMLRRFYAMALSRDGKTAAAEAQLESCYDRALAIDDLATAFVAQIELGILVDGFTNLARKAHPRSENCFQRALELAESEQLRNRERYLQFAHWHLGMALACRGAFDEAFTHLAVAEQIERGNDLHLDVMLAEMAAVHGWRGDWATSLRMSELAEELYRASGGTYTVGRALSVQAKAHFALHPKSERCLEICRSSLEFLNADDHDELAAANALLARIALNTIPPSIELATKAILAADAQLDSMPNPVVAFELARTRFEAALLSGQLNECEAQIARARSIASATRDAAQLAAMPFLDGLVAIVHDSDEAAIHLFEQSALQFEAIGDRFNYALAFLSAVGCRARTNDLTPAQVNEFLAFVDANKMSYVTRSAPRSASSLLLWCLKNGHEIERIEDIIADSTTALLTEIGDVAQSQEMRATSRAAAIRILARSSPLVARHVLTQIKNDPDPLVAGTVRAMLDYLPALSAPPLTISVISAVRVRIGEIEVDEHSERWSRKKSIELLRFLAIARAPVSKAAILGALWPESDTVADATLRVTLHALRRALEPDVEGSGNYVQYDGSIMRLHAGLFETTDEAMAREALSRAELLAARDEAHDARAAFERAIAIYSQVCREEDAAEWLRPYVRSWREACVQAHLGLAKLENREGDYEQALRLTQTALVFDPTNEETVALLLTLHGLLGELDSGRNVFLTYKRRLKEQLGASPGPVALERYSQLVQQKAAPSTSVLSVREREVLRLVAKGLSNKRIGSELGLSTWTVNNHVAKILRKLNVESRTAAAAAMGALE